MSIREIEEQLGGTSATVGLLACIGGAVIGIGYVLLGSPTWLIAPAAVVAVAVVVKFD